MFKNLTRFEDPMTPGEDHRFDIKSFPTPNSHGDPLSFPGWQIEVIDEILHPPTGFRLAIKLRISASTES
jgi:hypothetical protein